MIATSAVASPGSGSRTAGRPSSAYQKEIPPLTTLLAELLMAGTLTPGGGQCLLRIPCFSAASGQGVAGQSDQYGDEVAQFGEGASFGQGQGEDDEDDQEVRIAPGRCDAVGEDADDAGQCVTDADVQGVE